MQFSSYAQNGWNVIHTFDREVGCISFKDSLTGIVFSHYWGDELGNSKIYKTTDGGISWSEINVSDFINILAI